MGLKLVSGPSTYPVSLVEAKMHLREDSDDQDDLIELFIKAATGNAEKFLGRALIDQTWDYFLDAFPSSGGIELPLAPLIDVVGVFYRDGDGVEQEFDAGSYEVNETGEFSVVSVVSSGSWPAAYTADNAVRVRFRSGYVDSSVSPPVAAVPFDIKAAILLNIGSLYAHRETVVVGSSAQMLPWGAELLLRPHRVALGMA